jgi:hypothetical protein
MLEVVGAYSKRYMTDNAGYLCVINNQYMNEDLLGRVLNSFQLTQ